MNFSTGDPAAAEAWIDAHLSRISMSAVDPAGYVFSAVTAPVGDASVTRLRHSATASCHYDPLDTVFVCHSRGGRYVASPPGQSYQVNRGDIFVTYADRGFDFSFDNVDFDIVSLPKSAILAAAADLTGYEPGSVSFLAMPPVSSAAGNHWLATLAYTYRVVSSNSEVLRSPLVAAAMTRNLAACALTSFANTAVDQSGDLPRRALPASLRRAISFIESNVASDISLADVAAAARVTPRALQAGFRTCLDTTPISYLRQVRLAAARHDLQQADPASGATVAAIAARWGFASPRRFATDYRRVYGEPPSVALRR